MINSGNKFDIKCTQRKKKVILNNLEHNKHERENFSAYFTLKSFFCISYFDSYNLTLRY